MPFRGVFRPVGVAGAVTTRRGPSGVISNDELSPLGVSVPFDSGEGAVRLFISESNVDARDFAKSDTVSGLDLGSDKRVSLIDGIDSVELLRTDSDKDCRESESIVNSKILMSYFSEFHVN